MTLRDIHSLFFLFRRFGMRYAGAASVLVVISILAGLAAALPSLILSPALQLMDPNPQAPAVGLSSLTLNNLGPTLMQVFHLEVGTRFQLILVVSIGYALASLLLAVLNFISYVLAIWVRAAITRDMSIALQEHLLSLPLAFFHRQRTGDLVSHFSNDVSNTAYFIDSVSRGLLQSLVTVAICFCFLIRTDAGLAVAALAVGLAHFAITRLLSQHVRRNVHEQNVAIGGLAAFLQEVFLNIRTVKSFAAESFEVERLRGEAENVRRRMVRYAFFKHFEEPLRLVANACAISLVLVLAFLALDGGRLSLGGFAMFLLITQRVIDPVSQLFTHLLAASGMAGCAARLLTLFAARNPMPDGSQPAPAFSQQIELAKLSFRYESGPPVFTQVSMTLRRGEMVALVGASGVGKSTLADLILRLHDPQEGAVLLDGVNIREYKATDYRRLFGVVPQECLLFNASIRDNIVYGRPFDAARLQRAVELAYADEFVRRMPEGLATHVGDRGVRLSGGQRQRIAIARAVYDQPAILVLDEATSALDTESERLVQKAIEQVVRQITALVIAHRLSTVIHADRIVVLKEGRVEAVGPHRELLKTSPCYQELYRMQFAGNPRAEEPLNVDDGCTSRKEEGDHEIGAG